ncbi:MAG TPA: phosphoribosyltransferase family protein [Polyangiaceae bacterium]|nr:phosphoribosyltransferase family protein [Polyangiaceae bacterium]
MKRFLDRRAAGQLLGRELARYAAEAPIVVALPRGGLPVGFEVATALGAPLDVWVVRKLGAPLHPEFGMGAVAEGGYVHVDPRIPYDLGVSETELAELVAATRREVDDRVRRYRGNQRRPMLRGRTVIVVDDGIATGGTVAAALGAMRRAGATKLVLAVPVAAADSLAWLADRADEVICLVAPRALGAVGHWYEMFDAVSDEEALALLERARRNQAARTEREAS